MRKSSSVEALHAVRFAGWVLFTLFTIFLLLWGGARVFSVVEGSKLAGWAALTVGAVILLVTIERWGRQFYGLLFLGTFNALLMAGSGHLLNSPSVPVSRVQALLGAGLFALGGALTHRYKDSPMRAVDKAALLLLVGCITWAMLTQFFILPMAIGIAGLGIARGAARLGQGKGGTFPPQPPGTAAVRK